MPKTQKSTDQKKPEESKRFLHERFDMTAKHLILFLAFACNPIIALASECRMQITANNDTGWGIFAGLFNEKDEKLHVYEIPSKNNVVFKDLCAGSYKVIFKDGSKFTDSQELLLKYTVTTEGNQTKTSWSNGSVRYFVTKRGSGKLGDDKYKF